MLENLIIDAFMKSDEGVTSQMEAIDIPYSEGGERK